MSIPTFIRLDENAPQPSKGTPGSVGFDVYITKLKSYDENSGVYYFHTGWSVRAPTGYFPLMYPRSSLPKSGFMLANSVGVIDVDYQGELIVALVRNPESIFYNSDTFVTVVRPEASLYNNRKPLVLPTHNGPFKAVQIVFSPLPYMLDAVSVVNSESFTEAQTQRGEGGFGSTGN